MITLSHSIISPRSRPAVFAYVSDFTTVAEWDPGIVASERTRGDGGVGTCYDVSATFRGRVVPMTYEVVEYAAPGKIVLRGAGSAIEAVDTIECFDHDDGTRLVYTAEFRLKGLLRLAEPFMGGLFRSLGRRAIDGLAAALGG